LVKKSDIMRIGYACIAVGVEGANQRACIKKNASSDKLAELIEHNLNALETIIDYNAANKIFLFRISSGLIPFGSSHVNRIPWQKIFKSKFQTIGKKILDYKMRVSMHPGQYTVLNSPNSDTVKNAVEDLRYHSKVLDCLGVPGSHKIIMHIGGIYGDKKNAIKRFIKNYYLLDENIRKRMVVENDDKCYNINEVLTIGKIIKAPVVFDNLHNEINYFDKSKSELYWINKCGKTWNRQKDGIQKIHYSQQDPNNKKGAHSQTIDVEKFSEFYKLLNRKNIDIMLEVKDKNNSAIKCIERINQS